jgi:voltage-gated potassium channel
VGDILLVCLFSALLLAALYEVSDSPRQVAIGVLLAIPTLLASWTDVFLPSRSTQVAELITITIFLTYILLAILKRVLAAREVTLTELYRAVNLYIMIGIAFGMIYTLIELLIPCSFQFTYGENTFSSIFYFSFVALSTAGFGDIIAVSPIARSVVIIEMIIGVMYMAVLIGLLVNAHYMSRYASRRDDAGIGEPDTQGTRSKKIPFLSPGGPLSLIAIAVMLNLVTSIAMVACHMPVYMDTWGTSFAVIAGGFWVGATAGVLYNLIMAVTVWTPSSAIWATSSILVAALTWTFWRREWIDLRRLHLLVAAGLATGLLNAVLLITLTFLLNLPPYEGTMVVYSFFSGVIGSPAVAAPVSTVVVEVADKTLSLALAAVAALFIRDQMGIA